MLVAGVLVAGCTGPSGSASAAGSAVDAPHGGASAAAAAPTEAASADAGGNSAPSSAAAASSGPGSSADAGGSDVNLVDDRQIIRTASVALQVTAKPGTTDQATRTALADAAAQAATKIRALAPGSGGYVSASDGGGATVSITLRIPAAAYATVMADLSTIGDVTSRTEKTDDVTDQMIDVASRVASMRASVQRIRQLLAKADKIGDVISIESELEQREAQLESLENRQTALKGQVALSTITVTVTAVTPLDAAAAQTPSQAGFLGGLSGGWGALKSFGTGVAAVAGALLPFSWLIAAAVVALMWSARRRRRSRGAARPGAPAPTAGPGGGLPPAGPGDLA